MNNWNYRLIYILQIQLLSSTTSVDIDTDTDTSIGSSLLEMFLNSVYACMCPCT